MNDEIKAPAEAHACGASGVPYAWVYWHPSNVVYDGPETKRGEAVSRFTDDTRKAMALKGWEFEPLYKTAPNVQPKGAVPASVIAYMAVNHEGEVEFTDNSEAARELEGYGWAITPLAQAPAPLQRERLAGDLPRHQRPRAAGGHRVRAAAGQTHPLREHIDMSKFQALRRAKKEERYYPSDFWRKDQPKCPHCGTECDVSDNDWWRLYEEGQHEVTCPSCDEDFTVSTHVSFSFSTDEQEGMDEPQDEAEQD